MALILLSAKRNILFCFALILKYLLLDFASCYEIVEDFDFEMYVLCVKEFPTQQLNRKKETILRKSELQQKVLKSKKTQNSFFGHYFSFKKISQWKDIKNIDIIHFRYKLKWRILKMWGETIKFVCKLLICLLP